jgi:hypothetical protein
MDTAGRAEHAAWTRQDEPSTWYGHGRTSRAHSMDTAGRAEHIVWTRKDEQSIQYGHGWTSPTTQVPTVTTSRLYKATLKSAMNNCPWCYSMRAISTHPLHSDINFVCVSKTRQTQSIPAYVVSLMAICVLRIFC